VKEDKKWSPTVSWQAFFLYEIKYSKAIVI
jgi:hypothetical protein